MAQLLLTDDTAVSQDFPWHQLRFQHTQALRSALAAQYAQETLHSEFLCLFALLLRV